MSGKRSCSSVIVRGREERALYRAVAKARAYDELRILVSSYLSEPLSMTRDELRRRFLALDTRRKSDSK